jgi:hypothetical protein
MLRLYMVHLKGGEPGDKAYQQPVRAVRAETVDSCLVFFAVDGSIAGLFASDVVQSWQEIDEDQIK